MRKLLFFIALFFGSPTSAYAKTSLATQSLLQASLDSEKLTTQEGRMALARSVNQYCTELQQSYPTNSPSEDQWLDREIAGDSNRILKVLSTAEFGRRQTKAFLEQCISSSDWALKIPDKSIYFMVLAHAFLKYSSDAVSYANLNGVDAERSWLEGTPRAAAEALSYAAIMVEIEQK